MRGHAARRPLRVAMPYEVQTPVFEGPFDLLLHLILREQVDLYEVSLTTIVDAYLAELEQSRTLDLEVATEFLLIAATLVELKAQRLLPDDADVDLDDELALWEERDLLSPACSSARPSRTRPACWPACRRRPPAPTPAPPGSRSASSTSPPTCSPASTPPTCAAAFLRAITPKPVPVVDLDHVHSVRAQRHRRGRGARRRAAPRRAASRFRALTEQLRRAARGGRALPGRARAVQAGHGRPRPARRVRRHRDPLARRDEPGRRRSTSRRRCDRPIDRTTAEPSNPRAAGPTRPRRAIEAILMVADQPGRAAAAGPAPRDRAGGQVERAAGRAGGRLRAEETAASCW